MSDDSADTVPLHFWELVATSAKIYQPTPISIHGKVVSKLTGETLRGVPFTAIIMESTAENPVRSVARSDLHAFTSQTWCSINTLLAFALGPYALRMCKAISKMDLVTFIAPEVIHRTAIFDDVLEVDCIPAKHFATSIDFSLHMLDSTRIIVRRHPNNIPTRYYRLGV